jgi:hypothetical protein
MVVPRGGYIPLFISDTVGVEDTAEKPEISSALSIPELSEEPLGDDSEPATPLSGDLSNAVYPAHGSPGVYLAGIAALALLTLSLWIGYSRWRGQASSPVRAIASDIFWGNFFKADQDTFIVPSDSGLAIYEDLTGASVDLGSYVRSDYPKGKGSRSEEELRLGKLLGSRRYTSVVDLKLAADLSHMDRVNGSRLKIRYARELRLDDLKGANAILIGSITANPWVELFQKELNFQFSRDPKRNIELIHNTHPRAGEQEFYLTQEENIERTTYGVVAIVPNLDQSGYVLMMEGINMAGTEGAAEFLMSDRATSLLERVVRGHTLMAPFEILIETSNIGANAPEPKMIAERTW